MSDVVASEMFVGQVGDFASAWCASDEAFFDEEWFVDLLYGSGIFTDGRGNGGDAYGSSFELVDDGSENLVVDFVEAVLVNVECLEAEACDFGVDVTVSLHLCKVSDATEQRIGDTWRAAAPSGDFSRSFGVDA